MPWVFFQPALARILPDVFDFLFQLLRMPYDDALFEVRQR
jgi:hypothetical protein